MSVDFIYAKVPSIKCKGLCSKSCGPIAAGEREEAYFTARTGKPFPDAVAVLESKDMRCPQLNLAGRCEVYKDRPMICRLWGVTEGMPCLFGCKAERILSNNAAFRLMDQIEEAL